MNTDSIVTTDFPAPFSTGARVLTGNVYTNTAAPDVASREEIILLETGGDALVYNPDGTQLVSFGCNFDPGDLADCGRINKFDSEQLAVADMASDRIVVYAPVTEATPLPVSASLAMTVDAGDDLSIGPLCAEGFDEIVFADISEDTIHIIGYDWITDNLQILDSFVWPLEEGDRIYSLGLIPGAGTPGNQFGLEELLNNGGGWASTLHPDWHSSGYLLLIGEEDSIPAFYRSYRYYSSYWSTHHSDIQYLSTNSENEVPELRGGRII